MSYDEHDAAVDEFYDQISRKLYLEHKDQAISEFTKERLRSFYVDSPFILRPAVDCIRQGKKLLVDGYYPSALVSFVSAIELFLKVVLLKPITYVIGPLRAFGRHYCHSYVRTNWSSPIQGAALQPPARASQNQYRPRQIDTLSSDEKENKIAFRSQPCTNRLILRSTGDAAQMKVYYNSACPICKAGIEGQMNKDSVCEIQWNDVHKDNGLVSEIDSELEFVRERLHVVDENGDLRVGFNAFLAIWRNSPTETWKSRLFGMPVLKQTCQVFYNIFAAALYQWNRAKKHW